MQPATMFGEIYATMTADTAITYVIHLLLIIDFTSASSYINHDMVNIQCWFTVKHVKN